MAAAREEDQTRTLAARVGARLRKRRTETGRTLAEVAREAEVSVSYLSAVEHGANVPSLPVLARIVHALGVRIADVLRGEDEMRVQRSRLDPDARGAAVVSHPDLQLDVAFLVAEAGDAGDCPLPLDEADVFVFLRSGCLEVTVDGESWELRSGDALDAAAPEAVSWRALEPSVSVWAAGIPRPGR
ncbi:MAG: helix-turn-helix domain-containing protein [Solirubrobacteraceae bacterium]|nr:helix-turn-helix domain-containing protein [Solirubrobacteraceae bacterium]